MRSASEFELPLAVMREMIAASDLLPESYARFRPLLADALCFFVRRLPRPRLRAILAEQSALPVEASIGERVVRLLHHVPTLHKLGQVLARDRRLSPEFRARLQQLETLQPRTPVEEIRRQLGRELPRWQRAGIELGAQPLAEGSVAVVMPFAWREAPSTAMRKAVFKLLKPGIENVLAQEMEIWATLGDFLAEECARYHLPQLDYHETFETVKELLLHEVQLEREQRHLAEAAHFYADLETVVIPALLPFCAPRLTAMTRIPGTPLTHRIRRNDTRLEALGPVIGEALVARPMFASASAAVFHGDPHAGNLVLTPEGRLGILDWSLAGHLSKPDRIELIQLLLGALTLDKVRMEQALTKLSPSGLAPAALQPVLDESLRELRRGEFPGMRWLIRLLDRVVMRARARFRPTLLLFRKALLSLEGVLADLANGDDPAQLLLDRVLIRKFFEQFLKEWPRRWQHAPDSRGFDTHLSTNDLLGLFWSVPATFQRYWTGAWQDLLASRSAGPAGEP